MKSKLSKQGSATLSDMQVFGRGVGMALLGAIVLTLTWVSEARSAGALTQLSGTDGW